MSAPEPRANTLLLGQAGAEAALVAALLGGRMHHAWLLAGPEGVGKATLAFRFARRLLAGGASPSLALAPADPVFRRVAAGTHADLLTVEREWDEKRRRLRGEIGVDEVRGVAEFLRRTPAEGGWRVVVLDGAEHLNRNAANALLKILEEPPARAVLLLTCVAPGRLLPTIRSRCRRLALETLDRGDMASVLAVFLPEASAADRATLMQLGQGSPGRALRLAEEGGAALAGLAAEALRLAPALPATRALAIAEQATRAESGFGTFMELLRQGVAEAVHEAAEHGTTLPGGGTLAEWAEMWQAMGRIRLETERFNLDKRQAVAASLALLNGS